MKLIERYVLTNLIKNFALTMFLFLFLGFLTRIFHYSSLVTEESAGISDLLIILILIQAKIFVVLAPFTLLIASFITYNALIHSNEHIAMYNSGISEFGIIKPFFYISTILLIVTLVFSSILVPLAYKKMNTIREEIATKLSNSIIKPNQFIEQKGILIFINTASENKIAKGIIIVDDRIPEKKIIIASNQGKIGFDGSKILFDASKTYVSRKTDFSPFPLYSNFLEYKVSLFIKNFIDISNADEDIISNFELIKQVFSGNASFVREFKIRFGWAFFVVLLPFSAIFCLLKFFNFTRSRLDFTSLVISFITIGYVALSGFAGEILLNSSLKYLFLYYLNIFLIFSFLLFKLT